MLWAVKKYTSQIKLSTIKSNIVWVNKTPSSGYKNIFFTGQEILENKFATQKRYKHLFKSTLGVYTFKHNLLRRNANE